MLPGERTQEYLSPDRERRAVCDLCRDKVKRSGWVRADRAPQMPVEEPEKPRRRLRERLSGLRQAENPQPEPDPQPQPRAPTRKQRRGPDDSPERRIRRAIERFNKSPHRRTVEGLTRSLGQPRVAAVTPAEAPEQVRLTVAWDLSWYQWKVVFSDDADTDVSSLRSGKEVSELGPADRAWNARASEDGRLQLRVGQNGDGEAPAREESA
jgi:hypothetical protein